MVSSNQPSLRKKLTSLGVVVGIGFFFAFLMMGISWMQNRYTAYSTKQSEEFNTASRSVKPGLIASGIVSAWTWAATLLQSSTVSQPTTELRISLTRIRSHTHMELQVRFGTQREPLCKSFCSPSWPARSSRTRHDATHILKSSTQDMVASPIWSSWSLPSSPTFSLAVSSCWVEAQSSLH